VAPVHELLDEIINYPVLVFQHGQNPRPENLLLAIHLLGKGGPVLFRYFGITRPSVWQAIKRGEKFAKENDVKLLNNSADTPERSCQ
jgi:hypothetical protein